jgi:hypothetical protein
MSGIDPEIVIHEIKTYPDAKPIRQCLHPVHPHKATGIKLEVEKLLKSGFIYRVALIDWVSNLVPIDKKQGTIRVCVDYRDINKACAGYFWPSLFNDCILAVQKCHAFQTYNNKIQSHPAPLHPVVSVRPFAKWGIDFMTCHPHSTEGHGYIIVAIDYFTKWAEVMLKFDNTGNTAALFIFNHVIARFGVPQSIVTDHSSHFRNFMMSKLTKKLGLHHENSTPYYPQANGQVEAINKVLITMLRRMIGIHKTSWHTMLFSALWSYQTSVKSTTGFTPFRLVYGVEAILLIECEIPSLKLVVELLPNTSAEEECLYIMRLDKTRRNATLVIEAQKKCVNSQYDKHVKPRVFSKGDLILLYVQDRDMLGAGKFEAMW